MRPQLSIAIIARNEEARLPGLFSSLEPLKKELALQCVVVDTGSVDATATLAADWGAEVHHFAWCDDFSAARNQAVDRCRASWILWLDADDRLAATSATWLVENLENLDRGHACLFTIRSPQSHGGENSFQQLRLFPNLPGICFTHPIHESLAPSLKRLGIRAIRTPCEVHHTGYTNAQEVQAKLARNQALLERLNAAGDAPGSLRFSLARTYQVQGRWKDAETLFRDLLNEPEGQESSADVRLASALYLGQCLGFQNRPDEAVNLFEGHMPLGREHTQFLFEYSKALWVAGRVDQAVGLLKKCLELGPISWNIPTDWDAILNGARQLLAMVPGQATQCRALSAPARDTPPLSPVDRKTSKRTLTVITIVRNEEAQIPDLLAAIPLEEVSWVVVDTGSTDRTVELLEAAGVQVRHHPWQDDFSEARNHCLNRVESDWVLWWDADDRPGPDFWSKVDALVQQEPRQAYRFLVKCPRSEGGGESFLQLRLFPNHPSVRFEGRVHEQIGPALQRLGTPVHEANVEIHHLGYHDVATRKLKAQRNAALLRKSLQESPADTQLLMEYGNSLFQLEHHQEALSAYMQALPFKNPAQAGPPPEDETLAHFPGLIAEVLDRSGAKEQAAAWFRLAHEWDCAALKPAYWLAKQNLDSGQRQKALEWFEIVLARGLRHGRIARDLETLRRNALGFTALLRIGMEGYRSDSRAAECLRELCDGDLKSFPMDRRMPIEFFAKTGDRESLESYASRHLELFPDDWVTWEDRVESLLLAERSGLILELLAENAGLERATGVLAALCARAYESEGLAERALACYSAGLLAFPEDPSLIVHFADWTNRTGRFADAHRVLSPLTRRSEHVQDLVRQLETMSSHVR